MKTSLGIFFAVLAFFATAANVAQARDSFALNINTAPAPVYYATPPSYYAVGDEAYWWNAPVKIVYFEGRPHRMHYWQGRWYDEAWAPNYRHSRHDRYDRRDWRYDRYDRYDRRGRWY